VAGVGRAHVGLPPRQHVPVLYPQQCLACCSGDKKPECAYEGLYRVTSASIGAGKSGNLVCRCAALQGCTCPDSGRHCCMRQHFLDS